MRIKEQFLSEEQIDFLREMMNIGEGNAATALGQMFQCQVDMIMPRVLVIADAKELSISANPSLPVVCARMDMVNDIVGDLFFIVPEEHKQNLIRLAEQAMIGTDLSWTTGLTMKKSDDLQLSVIAEIGNIVAGVYLTAIHDFCKLNIYHTVPMVTTDIIQTFLDESLSKVNYQVQKIIVVENEFMFEGKCFRAFLVMIPSAESVNILVNSIEQARTSITEDRNDSYK